LPTDPDAILDRARTHVGQREWKTAAEAYAELIDHPMTYWGEAAFEYAAVLLLLGDQAGYKKVCGQLVDRMGKWDARPYHVARACSLAADSFTPPQLPLELAQEELDSNSTAFWSQSLQGILHYRAGRYRDALPLLQKSRDDETQSPDGVAATRMWMALTYHNLNQPEEARREYEEAQKWLATYQNGMPREPERKQLGLHPHNWLEIHLLRLEVAALLRPGQ
jgi:tetratricopeptide (TPR) repeat protein